MRAPAGSLDDIGDPLRLKHKNKRYVVMRRVESFPNCMTVERQIPVRVKKDPVKIKLAVSDDFSEAGERVKKIRLSINFDYLTVIDVVEVQYGYPNDPWIEPPGFRPRT